LGPRLAQCGLDQGHAKCHLDPSSRLATIDMGRKLGRGSDPFWEGGLGPHLTQCRLGQGLPPYQVASGSMQPFGHNRNGPKIGEGASPPFLQGTWSPSITKSPGLRLTSMPRAILIHTAVWPQSTWAEPKIWGAPSSFLGG